MNQYIILMMFHIPIATLWRIYLLLVTLKSPKVEAFCTVPIYPNHRCVGSLQVWIAGDGN